MSFSFRFIRAPAVLTTLLVMAGPAAADDSTQLELLGIFTSTDATRSTALVSIQGHDPLAARVGQSLPGDFRLQVIEHDRVLLTRGNRSFPLALQGRKRGIAQPPALPSQASSSMAPIEPVSDVYADACDAFANVSPAQREELQSLGICAR